MNISNLIAAIFALVFYLLLGLYIWKTNNKIKIKIMAKKSRQKKIVSLYFAFIMALVYGVFYVIFSN
ncbi:HYPOTHETICAL PROTEIN MCJ_003590 [Mesomycoplasma conjunctivae]|uniref:Uncharacterized protein n=1 Tax=Mesomycoplasma conjunctivae (strain ATCC 25834 / NCTC 10147 / HRC/581) TaxID=572263 RepID=C5J6F6_MESCH|nr:HYPOTHETICAL PROTEIN MCJ_003590 [Mesomycoplasma conjunctivae]